VVGRVVRKMCSNEAFTQGTMDLDTLRRPGQQSGKHRNLLEAEASQYLVPVVTGSGEEAECGQESAVAGRPQGCFGWEVAAEGVRAWPMAHH